MEGGTRGGVSSGRGVPGAYFLRETHATGCKLQLSTCWLQSLRLMSLPCWVPLARSAIINAYNSISYHL
jgi:hypothetical protein